MTKINIVYSTMTFKKPIVTAVIRQCIRAVLDQEHITADCEVNVLVTNDSSI